MKYYDLFLRPKFDEIKFWMKYQIGNVKKKKKNKRAEEKATNIMRKMKNITKRKKRRKIGGM